MTVNIHQFYRNPATNIEHYLRFYKKNERNLGGKHKDSSQKSQGPEGARLATFLCSSDVKKAATSD